MSGRVEELLAAVTPTLMAGEVAPEAVEQAYQQRCTDPEALRRLGELADAAAAYLDAECAQRREDLAGAAAGFTVADRHGFADAARRLSAVRRAMHAIWISEPATPNHGELVAAAVNGDTWAMGELLGYILPIVTRICRGRTGHLPDSARAIDDVVQEVCSAVVSALPRYRADAPFIAFVVRIATDKIADAYRAATRNKSRPMSDFPQAADPGAGPEQLVLQDERAIELGRLLDRLPERQRDIIVMRVALGMSADEVAAALESTPGAVRVAQHRALVALRRLVRK